MSKFSNNANKEQAYKTGASLVYYDNNGENKNVKNVCKSLHAKGFIAYYQRGHLYVLDGQPGAQDAAKDIMAKLIN